MLKNLIETRYREVVLGLQKKGDGDSLDSDSDWKYFEFRSSKLTAVCDSRACYNDDGTISDDRFWKEHGRETFTTAIYN